MDRKTEKIKRFLQDEEMTEALYSFLLSQFLRDDIKNDVQTLAAARLSITYLNDAWKALRRIKDTQDHEPLPVTNMGL